MRSIQRYLLAWTLGALVFGSVLMAVLTYRVTLSEMNEVFDVHLREIAEAIGTFDHAAPGRGNRAGSGAMRPLDKVDLPDGSDIVITTWTPSGQRVYASDSRVLLPFKGVEGLSHPHINGERWYVYTDVSSDGVAQAAQRATTRRELAGESALTVLWPMLLLVLVVGSLLVVGLRRGLRPLERAALDVASRSATALDPISVANVPTEIAPLVQSVNDLIDRLSLAFSAQRRFLADAAHELRTPVTALRLQLQLLKRTDCPASRADALADLELGIDRTQRLIEQLLQVARAEPDGAVPHNERLDLAELVRAVVGNLSAKAQQRGIDLGAQALTGVWIQGDLDQLTVLLNNLVENALRYTPVGGVVDVAAALDGAGAVLRVVDNGPGIPESERGQVFTRFYRGQAASALARDGGGSGLGLAIVQAIAERHHAVASLHTPASGQGLEVRVVFAAAGS
jgi:two-component system, OmpR family, sensor kinase